MRGPVRVVALRAVWSARRRAPGDDGGSGLQVRGEWASQGICLGRLNDAGSFLCFSASNNGQNMNCCMRGNTLLLGYFG